MQDVALARQKVVSNANAIHGREVALDNFHRNELGHVRGLIAILFDFLKRLAPKAMLWVLRLIKGADARVQIPAVVVKLERFVLNQPPDISQGLFFEISESHDHIGNLNARVVDVVLDFDMTAGRFQNADESVPNRGIPQMTDVSRLIRVDVGVLDDNFAGVDRDLS
jgi:hypothetical protein